MSFPGAWGAATARFLSVDQGSPFCDLLYLNDHSRKQRPAAIITGLGERIPCALFAIPGIAGAAVIGRQLKDERLGVVSAMLLGTTVYYLGRGHEVYLDIALAAIVVWSLAAFLAAYLPSPDRPRPGLLLACYTLITAAFMTKGIIGVLIPGLTIMGYLLARGDLRGFFRIKPGLGLLIFLLGAVPWHYALYRQGGAEYFKNWEY